ncbi:MAG TPA: hypothetical protein VFJ77_01000 [Gaiellaceae bacterium]|nr:hypothetical protein [Gaiellaceae bacterium]
MKALRMLLVLAALTALVGAASAAASGKRVSPFANAPYAVAGSGTVRAFDTKGTLAHFWLNSKAPHVLVYRDAKRHLTFRSVSISSVQFLRNTVRLTGMGTINGSRLVRFTSIAVGHEGSTYSDRFGLIYNHKAMWGGRLRSGHVYVTPKSGTSISKGAVPA